MPNVADRLKSLSQSQLELALDLCKVGLSCCEHLTEINAQAARTLLAQAGTDDPSGLQGNGTAFMVGTSRTLMDHWASTRACYTEYQQQVLTRLAKK